MHMKHLKNGLIVIGTAGIVWRLTRIVALSAYSKVGPFVNSSAPGIDQNFLNGLENYLNGGVAKSGVPLMSWFGPYSVTTTPTFQNHNLHNASGTSITPDLCILQITGTSVSVFTVEYDSATMTSTQVKLTSNNSGGVTTVGIALKF